MGYLPEAMINYLMRLGWSHGDDEIFTREQIKKWFTLEAINKAPSRLDFKKLADVNAHYIRQADNSRLIDLILKRHNKPITDIQKNWLLKGMDELKLRATTLIELLNESLIYIVPIVFEDKAKQAIKDGQEALRYAYDSFNAITEENFTSEVLQSVVQKIVDDKFDGKFAKIGIPLRAALTGKTNAPSVHNIAYVLGKSETLYRLKTVIE
jgi:glutamyl-tRNA synthetase